MEAIISSLFMSDHRYQLFDAISGDTAKKTAMPSEYRGRFLHLPKKGSFSSFCSFSFFLQISRLFFRWSMDPVREKLTIGLTVYSRFCRGSCRFWCSRIGRFLPIPRCNTSTWGSQCASTGPSLATAIFPLFVHRRRRIAEGPLTRLGHLLAVTSSFHFCQALGIHILRL